MYTTKNRVAIVLFQKTRTSPPVKFDNTVCEHNPPKPGECRFSRTYGDPKQKQTVVQSFVFRYKVLKNYFMVIIVTQSLLLNRVSVSVMNCKIPHENFNL